MKLFKIYTLIFSLIFLAGCWVNQSNELIIQPAASESDWPDSLRWWERNNLRLLQTNLPAYEAATLNPDSLLADLKNFSANTLLINAAGIMAFYETELEYHYTNPYMQPGVLKEIIEKCHKNDIRVVVRFDFSRAHESIFEQHPDWFYISPEGNRINNHGMYTISINAPYEQEHIFSIVEEVIDKFPIDGLFINMFGYQTWDPYQGVYHGIDQNPYEKKRFREWSGGLTLPVEENYEDPVFQKYLEFKEYTSVELLQRLHDLVKSKDQDIAICTYVDEYVDIIRHETLTRELPYWPYHASDNVNHIENSYPGHIVSNASIQQISFQSRYNAVEPEEVSIRLYQNIANGSGLDISLMGDFREYEDERNYEVFREVYGHHKKYEAYYGRYTSPSEIAVIAPGFWPGGESMEEYRGIQKMLKEAHLQFDIIENSQVGNLKEQIKKYRLIILPEITSLDDNSLSVLKTAVEGGTHLIATNRSLTGNPDELKELFGAVAEIKDHEGGGNYLKPENKILFSRFEKQMMLFWKYNLGLYDLSNSDTVFLPILSKGRPGPPEMIGGHEPTGYYAMGVKEYGNSKAVILPMNLGKIYYLLGYEQHKNILLDVIDYLFPDAGDLVQTDAHERVEVVLQQFRYNLPEKLNQTDPDGMILHLINITGFSGNTYFEPHTQEDITFRIRTGSQPEEVLGMKGEKTIPFNYEDGYVSFEVERLEDYDGIVIN